MQTTYSRSPRLVLRRRRRHAVRARARPRAHARGLSQPRGRPWSCERVESDDTIDAALGGDLRAALGLVEASARGAAEADPQPVARGRRTARPRLTLARGPRRNADPSQETRTHVRRERSCQAMKPRHMLAAVFALLLLPLAAGAVVFGALCGLQSAAEQLRRLSLGRRRPAPRPRAQMPRAQTPRARPAAS